MIDLPGTLRESWNVSQQIGIAYLLTALIGWDREREAHTTGIRTFPIVGMASCGYILVLGSQPDTAAQSRVLQGLIRRKVLDQVCQICAVERGQLK